MSRAPILPAPVALNPEGSLIGLDTGQAEHMTAIRLNCRAVYQELIDGGGAPAAKQAFKERVRKVRGKHSKERRLQARTERVEAARRAFHADTPAGRTSAQDAMDHWRAPHHFVKFQKVFDFLVNNYPETVRSLNMERHVAKKDRGEGFVDCPLSEVVDLLFTAARAAYSAGYPSEGLQSAEWREIFVNWLQSPSRYVYG